MYSDRGENYVGHREDRVEMPGREIALRMVKGKRGSGLGLKRNERSEATFRCRRSGFTQANTDATSMRGDAETVRYALRNGTVYAAEGMA